MKPLYWCRIIAGCILLRPPHSASSIEIYSTRMKLAQFLTAAPFFPIVAVNFLPRDTPASYLRRVQGTHTADEDKSATTTEPTVLVCIGDSLTHGSVSVNWVSKLSRRLGDSYTVLNAGKNCETAAAVRARLEEIVAVRPAAITLMIGTNDLIGSLYPTSAGWMYQKVWWAQKTVPSLDGYARELEAIVHELDNRLEEFGTQIAVLSPPPLGEGGPTGRAWKEGEKVATICSDVCKQSSERVSYIPLYNMVKNEMVDTLSAPPSLPEGQQQLVDEYSCEFSFKEAIPLTSIMVPWRLLLGHRFDKIREANGYKYTIDSIHFGQEFSDVVEKAVTSWIASF